MKGLDDLYAFKTVVDCGGFSQAARRYGLPKATLARRVADLEKQLGSALLHRGNRSFSLTEFGKLCLARADAIAQEADALQVLADEHRHSPAGRLKIVCPPLFSRFLIEHLAVEFAADLRGVHVCLEQNVGQLTPRNLDADLVLHPCFGELPDSALISRRILSSRYVLAAHPDVPGLSDIAEPEDLVHLPCLSLSGMQTDGRWPLRKGERQHEHRFSPRFSTNVPSGLMQAAQSGLGVAALPYALCRADIEAGRLRHVLPDWSHQSITLYAIHSSNKTLSRAARSFIDFVMARLTNADLHSLANG